MVTLYNEIASLRGDVVQQKAKGSRIAIVPTMGNLHQGHLHLIELAKQKADIVIATIFVNQLQFGLTEDWELYPRTLERDVAALQKTACDWLFVPEHTAMYPNGLSQQTLIVEPSMSKLLCGISRPGHFDGVTTVLTKLINIIEPHQMILGSKDYQQLQISRKMLSDVCSPVEIIPAPIAREIDGLAYSSRNTFLSVSERPKAAVLYQNLCLARDKILAGRLDFRAIEQEAQRQIAAQGFRIDYFSICRTDNLQRATSRDTDCVVLGAMYADKTRLIDNIVIDDGL